MITGFQSATQPKPYFIVLAIIALFLLGRTNFTYSITIALRATLYPVLAGTSYSKTIVKNEWATFTQLRSQRSQIEQLQEENARLLSENAFMKILREEQKSWYQNNHLYLPNGYTPVPATIISTHENIILTAKSEVKIPDGSAIAYQQAVIGFTHSQQGQTIIGRSLTHVTEEVPTIIVNQQGVLGRGILKPSYGTTLKVEQVLQNVPVEPGDVVMLLSSNNLPDGLEIGKVESIKKRESDIFQTLNVLQSSTPESILNVIIYSKNGGSI